MASEKDIQDIINTLIAEGVGEGQEGMRRIAETILNRAEQRGISPAEVVRQRAQYTGYSAPGPGAVRAQGDPSAISAAQAAWQLAQGPDDPTGGANHYFNPNIVTPSWASAMTPTGQFGNHAFYTDRPIPRLPPVPANLSTTGAAVRQMTSPSGGNSDLQTALDRVATRERNRVVPAPAEDRVTARNRSVWQSPSPFNGDPLTPANGPVVASIPTMPRPPTTRPVATTTVRPSASDLVRGNPMQTKNQVTTIASIPTKPQVSASDLVRGNSAFPTTAQITAATGFRPPPTVPDRLPQGVAGLPALYGTGNVAGVGTKAVAPQPFARPPSFPATQVAQGKVAPVPFNRPTAVGTQLAVKPMPPMPIPRPPGGIGGPDLMPSAPMPAQMSPLMALQRSLPTLRPPTSPAAQRVWMTGFSDSGSSGGAHGGSENDKRRGETITPKGRSY
jgi:hypothetical protein